MTKKEKPCKNHAIKGSQFCYVHKMKFGAHTKNLKSREDYLIAFEEKLILSFKDVFRSIDRNFIIAYGLSLLMALFAWGSVKEISFMGAQTICQRI